MCSWIRRIALLTGSLVLPVSAQQATRLAGGQVDLMVGYSANPNRLSDGRSVLLQGGSTQLTARLGFGLAGVASFTGLHANMMASSAPQTMLVATFGPRWTLEGALHGGRTARTATFVQALVGEADGFDGVYPSGAGFIRSANSLAVQLGGGLEVALTQHVAVRAVQVDLLQTQLPNATNNRQRSLLVGAGVVWHTGDRP